MFRMLVVLRSSNLMQIVNSLTFNLITTKLFKKCLFRIHVFILSTKLKGYCNLPSKERFKIAINSS